MRAGLYALRWFQRRCEHPGDKVIADILQRDNLPTVVSWCSRCGAVAVNRQDESGVIEFGEMRRPQPTW